MLADWAVAALILKRANPAGDRRPSPKSNECHESSKDRREEQIVRRLRDKLKAAVVVMAQGGKEHNAACCGN